MRKIRPNKKFNALIEKFILRDSLMKAIKLIKYLYFDNHSYAINFIYDLDL